MAYTAACSIYSSPKNAEKVETYPKLYVEGDYFTRADFNAIKNYYDNTELGYNAALSALTGLLLSPLGALGFLVGAGLGYYVTAMASELLENRDSVFEEMATSDTYTPDSWYVKLTYTYKRHGSNDGAWMLSDATAILK